MTKRLLDLLLAVPALLVTGPAMILLGLAIRLESPGPALFRQERIGREGRVFLIHKFRTMRQDAESLGPRFTVAGDSRVTTIGLVLRRHKLDELPQLIDVIAGHMSLVGPRPEVAEFVALWPESARKTILALRPGITDPVSLEHFDESAILASSPDPGRAYVEEIMPRKVQGYIRYAHSRSLFGDIHIIWLTLLRIFRL